MKHFSLSVLLMIALCGLMSVATARTDQNDDPELYTFSMKFTVADSSKSTFRAEPALPVQHAIVLENYGPDWAIVILYVDGSMMQVRLAPPEPPGCEICMTQTVIPMSGSVDRITVLDGYPNNGKAANVGIGIR